jgi:hypothetical protein
VLDGCIRALNGSVDGLPIARNAAWTIVSTSACLVPTAGVVVPQGGTVE